MNTEPKTSFMAKFFDALTKPTSKNFFIEVLKTLAMLVASMLLAVVIILIAAKEDPAEAIRVFLLEPFADEYNASRILTESIPLMFTGAAVCLMARAGQFNMFVEGGFFVGAFVSAVLAPELCTENSTFLLPIACILIGTVAATAIGYVPAKLKSSLGVDEFVSSLMLNYIVLWVVLYLVNNVVGDPEVTNKTKYLEDWAKLPFLNYDNELSLGFLLALIAPILAGIFLFKTKWGYAIRMTGANASFANYAGINTKGVVLSSNLIGSALAGFGGGVFLLGNYYRFEWKSLPNYGFDGFVIAIMARNNPFLVPFASLFLAYLRTGAHCLSAASIVPNEIVYIIQGLIIILFGAKFLLELKFKKKAKKEENK